MNLKINKRTLFAVIALVLLFLFFAETLVGATVPKISTTLRRERELRLKTAIERSLGAYGHQIIPHLTLDESIFEEQPHKGFSYLFTDDFKKRGLDFIKEHQSSLDYVEVHFHVSRSAIVAAPAIEWWYPDHKVWPVASTLYTQAILGRRPKRRTWAQKELLVFLAISEKNQNGWDVLALTGSWEGAFGEFQFLPSSYRLTAMRWDGTACVRTTSQPFPDPFNSDDVICSVGNYLHSANWSSDETSHRKAVWAYNHWRSYVYAYLDYADLLEGKKPSRYRIRQQ